MIELFISALYWILNILIILTAISYAFSLWGERNRVLYGIMLFVGGILWHIGHGVYAYQHSLCKGVLVDDSFITLANKCVPSIGYDIIYAQIAIFTGLFVLLAALYQRFNQT